MKKREDKEIKKIINLGFPSNGLSAREKGFKINRDCHFLSDLLAGDVSKGILHCMIRESALIFLL